MSKQKSRREEVEVKALLGDSVSFGGLEGVVVSIDWNGSRVLYLVAWTHEGKRYSEWVTEWEFGKRRGTKQMGFRKENGG